MAKKKHQRVSAPPITKVLGYPITAQIKTYHEAKRQLSPEYRHKMKRFGRMVFPLPYLETLCSAIEDNWKEQHEISLRDPDYFEWPSTKAWLGTGGMLQVNWSEEGILSLFGYVVNQEQNLDKKSRCLALDEIFSLTLPPLYREMRGEWGQPNSALRLKKMANCLASFARNAIRRNDSRHSLAIDKWTSDLAYLRSKYYVGKFGFDWPKTTT